MSGLSVRATENGVLVGNRLLNRSEALALCKAIEDALYPDDLRVTLAASSPPLDSPPECGCGRRMVPVNTVDGDAGYICPHCLNVAPPNAEQQVEHE